MSSLKRNRPSVRSLALSLQSIETDVTPHEALIQQQTSCDLLASEIDLEIEEQFESICCESEPNNKEHEKKENEPGKILNQGMQTEIRKILSTSASDIIGFDSHHLQRAKSLPKRNTTLSTFWKLVDKHNLKPLEPILYLPDTSNLASLQSRIKSGDIEFEELTELSKVPEGISKSADLVQKESVQLRMSLQELSMPKAAPCNPVANNLGIKDEALQREPVYLVCNEICSKH